jgi:hypothetical protein
MRGKKFGEGDEISNTPPPGPDPHPIDSAIRSWHDRLLAVVGVEGVGHGLTPDGRDAVLVWVSAATAADALPTEIEGYPVLVLHVSGGFHAQ